MSKNYLFPFKTRWVGLILILVHIPIKLMWDAKYPNGYSHSNPMGSTDEMPLFAAPHLFYIGTTLLVLVGLFLIAFSKEKIEDEHIAQLRLDSLRWAIYLNYAILLFTLVFTQGGNSKHVLTLNLWLPLLFFILRFQWVLYRMNRSAKTE